MGWNWRHNGIMRRTARGLESRILNYVFRVYRSYRPAFAGLQDDIGVRDVGRSYRPAFAGLQDDESVTNSLQDDRGVGEVEWERGSMLIELLVGVVMISVTLTAVAALVTSSMSASRAGSDRVVANRLAVEGVEWLRGQRDIHRWGDIVSKGGGDVYCINTLVDNLDDWLTGSCEFEISDAFSRTLNLTYDNTADKLVYVVRVAWLEGGREPSIILEGELRRQRQ